MLKGLKLIMNIIEQVELKPLNRNSIYLKPFSIQYTNKGTQKSENCIKQHDAVAIIIYNTSRKVLVFVKQFRPPIYISHVPENERSNVDVNKYPSSLGITLEVCAGIVDKNLTLPQIAKEEVLEECGYDVPLSNLVEISQTDSAPKITTYYCEVTDDMRVNVGGGVDEEMIDIVEMSVDDMKKYISQEHVKSPPSFMFCMYWFLYNKVE